MQLHDEEYVRGKVIGCIAVEHKPLTFRSSLFTSMVDEHSSVGWVFSEFEFLPIRGCFKTETWVAAVVVVDNCGEWRQTNYDGGALCPHQMSTQPNQGYRTSQ